METSEEPEVSREDVRKQLLEIAKNRPGTNVSKCIQSYEEDHELSSLVTLLEEVSKNTDFSTDLRFSLGYYLEEFVRHCRDRTNVSRRSAMVAAGSVLLNCGKIYGDRVEHLFQVVEHQIESLLSSESQKESTENGKSTEEAPQPRKRRAKKLTQKEVDPFMVTLEPRKIKRMTEEKRFSTLGFVKCNRNQTIEYLYQDHMPPNLWRNASIVDPHNPYEEDEKKNYKLFTYHAEHRYNTLLPDIPFERLNLIKEYVLTNQVNTSEILNEHMTSEDYLNEYIALENQMLASRYGAKTRARAPPEKRVLEDADNQEISKKTRLEDQAGLDMVETSLEENQSHSLQNQLSMDSGKGDSLNSSEEQAWNLTSDDCHAENSTLSVSQIENSTLNPTLSSTLSMNESSILDSTRLDLPPANPANKDESLINEQMQMDFGISLDEVNVTGKPRDW